MHVVRHDDEAVELISALIAIMKQELLQQFGVGSPLKKGAALIGYGGDRVRGHDWLGKAYGKSLRPGCGIDANRIEPKMHQGQIRDLTVAYLISLFSFSGLLCRR